MTDKHFVAKTKTNPAEKDLWQTPQPIFDKLTCEFGFELDACASAENALCSNYFTEHYSALDHEWNEVNGNQIKSVFINPPYSATEQFLNRAADQCQRHGLTVVALVNANTDTGWFHGAAKKAYEVRIIQGRIGFVHPTHGPMAGNTKGQCLIIYKPKQKAAGCHLTTIKRKELAVIHVISLSGGRSSGVLVHEMEKKRKIENIIVKYIFMDTGAEHPKTYEFIRKIVEHYGIDLICIRAKTHPEHGVGNTYEVVSIDDIGCDLKPWRDHVKKYGLPSIKAPQCTDRMKVIPYEKYCNDHFGKGNYMTWLGIRADEPKRLKPRKGVSYLANISDFDKQDVLDFWKRQPFDLEIPEHLGNCAFCIKKGSNKIALAARDEPQLATDFINLLDLKNVRQDGPDAMRNNKMYRGRQSLQMIIDSHSHMSRDEIASTIRSMRRDESNSCSESCEIIQD